MVVVHVLAALGGGIAAAAAALWAGWPVWFAPLAYAGGGAVAILGSAAITLALPDPRDPSPSRAPRALLTQPEPVPVRRHG